MDENHTRDLLLDKSLHFILIEVAKQMHDLNEQQQLL